MNTADGTMIAIAVAVFIALITMLWQGHGSTKQLRAELGELRSDMRAEIGRLTAHMDTHFTSQSARMDALVRDVADVKNELKDLTVWVSRLEDRLEVTVSA